MKRRFWYAEGQTKRPRGFQHSPMIFDDEPETDAALFFGVLHMMC